MSSRSTPGTNSVIRPIRNSKEFEATVAKLDYLVDQDPKEGTPAYDRMELLGILIAAYEDAHLPPLEQATPQDLVQFMAEQKGLSE
jgi:HTH-type transcriptional regulator/antitoxin HigA